MFSAQLPTELAFLELYRLKSNSFRNAKWLTNDFEDHVWKAQFGSSRRTIDFGVRLDDGLLLTHPRHKTLLHRIKSFLCLQTHPYWTGDLSQASGSQRSSISLAIQVLDYFLIRSRYFKIAANGFSNVSDSDIANFVVAATSNGKAIKSGLYSVTEELYRFLQHHQLDKTTAQRIFRDIPGIASLDEARSLPLSDEKVLNARALLWHKGFYRFGEIRHTRARTYQVNGKKLWGAIFENRILGNCKFDNLDFDDFEFCNSIPTLSELPPVPISSEIETEQPSEELLRSYLRVLRSMNLAFEHGILLIPPKSLSALDNKAFLHSRSTKQRGRFSTLPCNVAEKALSDAIGFFLDHGNDIVTCYLNSISQTRDSVHHPRIPLDRNISLKRLRVSRWRIPTKSREQFFKSFRQEPGLHELLQVLYGSILIIVNSLMARRMSELLALRKSDLTLTTMGYYLSFPLGKANVFDHRPPINRPLPNIGAQAIELLIRLHDGLANLGFKSDDARLFDFPHISQARTIKASKSTICQALNRFCDYFSLPGDVASRRYYIRPHQLRRNFALQFFWRWGVGGIDPLRYFLGHLKPEHTYRYISETVPGEVLNRVKAEYAASRLQEHAAGTESLADLMKCQYGIGDFTIMRTEDVADYIEDLLNDSRVEIEPIFFETPDDQQEYRIMIKVLARF